MTLKQSVTLLIRQEKFGLFLCVSQGFKEISNKSKINMKLKIKPLKKEYIYPIDRVIIYKVEVNECEGIHALTAIFYSGDGNVYQINEGVLRTSIQLKVNLKEERCNIGVWKLDIYLDGGKYTSEYFRVSHRIAKGTNIINVKLQFSTLKCCIGKNPDLLCTFLFI